MVAGGRGGGGGGGRGGGGRGRRDVARSRSGPSTPFVGSLLFAAQTGCTGQATRKEVAGNTMNMLQVEGTSVRLCNKQKVCLSAIDTTRPIQHTLQHNSRPTACEHVREG